MGSANVIPDRIAESLRRFPPFSMLPHEDVRKLAVDASVRVLVAGDVVWKQGDAPGTELYFLARGRVEYVWQVEERSELVDVRDVGDVLGLTALLKGEPFRVTAQVVEDSLLFGVPWAPLKALLDVNDAARNYARRHLFWATRVGGTVALPEPTQETIAGRAKNILQAHLDGAQTIRPREDANILTCRPEDSIHHAATLMAARRIPSIIVIDEERRPIGIVTNTTLVKEVIVGSVDKSAPVKQVMGSPVVTVSAGSSATAALLTMLRLRIGQVCVTADGTPGSPVLDVCSQKDLLAQSGHHPAGLLREISNARSPARFRELCDDIEAIARSYLEAGVSAIFLGQMCAELYDELVQRLLILTSEEMRQKGSQLPDVPWAWLSVGSDGRREQILRTDMDNALIFASSGSADQDEQVRKVLLELTNTVVAKLVDAGFARCQGGVMASNPRWCRTDAEWISELESVDVHAEGDAMLRATILYDMRFVAGNREISERVRDAMLNSVNRRPDIQRRLAEMVVDTPPPLNFFGRFVVEKLGGRQEGFDIKQRAMAPLRDAARVLTFRHHLTQRHSTGGRWDELRRNVPRLKEVATLARDSYDVLLRLRTMNGLRNENSGRYIDPSTLTKLERAQLANVFDVVRMVQNSVKLEFELQHRV
jgi:CBS domain-containing protein